MSENRPVNSFNSQHKNLIREKWNQPLIKYLVKKTGTKLLYVGLPSSKAEDILLWIEYIKSVVAFQCREYGRPSSPLQDREEIEKLEQLLRELERTRKLEDFVVYDGYFEEIILRGNDNSPHRIPFEQSSFVTLYNLDFCNQITSPMEYLDDDGNVQVVYKFTAIQRLLKYQDSLGKFSEKFIFFLTIHSSYHGKELHTFINTPPDSTIEMYIEKYKKLSGEEKNARIIRLFVVSIIRQYFAAHNFSAKILPVVKYKGIGNTPLLHFVVMGTKPKPTAEGVQFHQKLDEIINSKFVTIESDNFVNADTEIEEIENANLNVIDLFVNSDTYKKLWV